MAWFFDQWCDRPGVRDRAPPQALKSQATLPRLQAMADHHADPAKRTRAQMWVKAIKG
ncbi:MAG: hypothetical protein JNK53_06540 [Phycisphaerae bacterium]|nr:hypothetical protein [Phycisphaerae bacterium]